MVILGISYQNICGQGITRHERLILWFVPENTGWFNYEVWSGWRVISPSCGDDSPVAVSTKPRQMRTSRISSIGVWVVLERGILLSGDEFSHFQRLRSRSRSIGKYEGGSARLQKIRQIKQNTEANYQTVHGTGIEQRKPLKVAFSPLEKASQPISWI